MNIEQRISELVEEKLAEMERPDVFLVDIRVSPAGNRIAVLLDGDNGVGIDECARISRFIGFKLEEENAIDHAYNLEVSSPGIDTPLLLARQYIKNIGREVAVKLTDGLKKEGKLLAVTNEAITIEEKIKPKGKKAELAEAVIQLQQIKEIRVLISFK